MPTIIKTESNSWKAVIRKTGWPTTIKTFRLKKDAEDWARRTEDEMVRGAFIRRPPATIERVTVPLLRPQGTTLLLSGGGVSGQAVIESFNYDDTDLGTDGRAVSAADTRKFAPDGSLIDRSQSIAYHGNPPHLFRQDRVLVIYAGTDPVVLSELARLLGKQFAGG